MAIDTIPANRHEHRLAQQVFTSILPHEGTERIIRDKASDDGSLNEKLANEGNEMISPQGTNRRPKNKTLDNRPPTAGRWNARLNGFSTIGGRAVAGQNQPLCLKA